MKKTILTLLLLLPALYGSAAAPVPEITPDATYMFIRRDTGELFMDVYEPAKESQTMICGKTKPTIVFMFGGGFIDGSRDSQVYHKWFKDMTGNGYRIVSIDYRLGLRGQKSVGVLQVKPLENAIRMAVEDLYSAILYILDNADTMGIEPDNIVLSGSSAGAISVLQADYELSNRTECAACMPEDFRFAGVMPFAGAIFSRHGKLKYKNSPAPTAFFHGTSDKLVNYKQIRFFNLGFFGSDKIAKRFRKLGFPHYITRFTGHGHEVAEFMDRTEDLQFRFLEQSVMNRSGATLDITVQDPDLPKGTGVQSRKALYGN